jgi:hypothetical protein
LVLEKHARISTLRDVGSYRFLMSSTDPLELLQSITVQFLLPFFSWLWRISGQREDRDYSVFGIRRLKSEKGRDQSFKVAHLGNHIALV